MDQLRAKKALIVQWSHNPCIYGTFVLFGVVFGRKRDRFVADYYRKMQTSSIDLIF